ncbi:DNA damage-inducible protein I [Erwinia aphidicola]|jgi:DNA-damage-inducible protein I|uniref:DNA damage-inducible protein I n=1 Tax=Erwinia aphidicola TaxID=68334 RepID=A0ABU8DCK6_ERWAP|nr:MULTISPECIES: DNA damage-inducible protein I [Erwinia]KMV70045.1 damage-inducible protein I [bacteria symbiont BFo1 of Frankliniella occidentalis]PIJ60101.1 DNA damage-inducible protein I [Erwinia sp. OLMDLW33]VTT28164.1 DNA-damage-inducible protein I [Klebsiella pneumoniae]KYP91006.1 damage-inducible protein I [bacteria symbiont BFo1 of Frankliniella occidentalis]MBD1374228.1 DNA damage-inducible protein I [Erwinia aphidicola]
MRIEVTVAKTTSLPAGAIDALTQELSKRIDQHFPDGSNTISVRYASANNLTVMGGGKEAKDRITDILQETWESADDWFITD